MEGGITEGNFGRATRTTAIVAIFAAVLMLGIPSFDQSIWSNDLAPVGEAAAAGNPGNRQLTLGWADFTTTIATLNPMDYTMATEYMVFAPCYSTLLTFDIDGKTRVGDLARTWTVSPNGLFWNFTLTPNAKFYDKNLLPANFHSVTAADVVFTVNLIKNEPLNYYHSYFPDINGQNVLKSIAQGPGGAYDLRIELANPYAPFTAVLTGVPIFPAYIWTGERWDWDNFGSGKAAIVGSGPFFYNLTGLPQTGMVELDRNPYWHMTAEYGAEVRTDKLYIRSETSDDTNLNNLINGVNDAMMYALASQYINVLSKPEYSDIFRFDASTGFVYEFNLNQMTDARRDTFPAKYRAGGAYNNQLLLNPVVKEAIAKSINKQAFIDQVRGGMGDVADSLVPLAHPYHYTYGSDPLRDTLDLSFDPQAARQLLRNDGWTYNLAGQYVLPTDTTTFPLCKAGASDPLRFRFYTLDTTTEWEAAARLIAGWAQQAGIDLWTEMKIKNVNDLNGDWTTANYDIWIWDWIFSPTSEISTDIMCVLTSFDAWTDVFWADATYDSLYNRSLVTMDPEARKIYTDEMQRLAYENMGCQLVGYRADLYASSSRGPEQWTNWGNWKVDWPLIPDQGYPWLWLQVQPKDNLAPKISGISVPAIGYVDIQVDMSAVVTDSNTMQGKWFYDREGNNSAYADVSSGGTSLGSHTYTKDGEYTVYFAVKEKDGLDHFVNYTKKKIQIFDMSNDPPEGVDFTKVPDSNINAGTIVTFTAQGSDPEGDPLYYSWTFGDGGSDQGKVVQHQFRAGAPSTVTVSVTDNRFGFGTRPQPMFHVISVGPNDEPSVSVNDPGPVPPNQFSSFTVTASDPELDPLRYTWDWGDGTGVSVTSAPTADHKYRNQGLYTLTANADDLTTLFGHNVSDTRTISVRRGDNVAPTLDSWGIGPTRNTVRFYDLSFYANATDSDNDALRFTFTFESGVTQSIVVDTNTKTENAVLLHDYTTTGFRVASVSVTDYVATVSSTTLSVTVAMGDREPVISALSNIKETVGFAHSFTASASDPDPDTVTYWWDFGDYLGSAAGQTPSYSYVYGSGFGGFLYRVWANDNNLSSLVGPMNVSQAAYAYVNWIPYLRNITSEADNTAVDGAKTLFQLNAWDNDTLDNSTLKITWDFGDGTVVGNAGRSVSHTYVNPAINSTYRVQVWINDMWVDDFARSHNVTKWWYVNVTHNPNAPTQEFSRSLVSGWNFVTVPLVGHGYMASTLPLDAGDIVAGYNSATEKYDQNYVVGFPLGDFAVSESTGYWIYSGVAKTVHLYGSVPATSQARTITVPAGGGWVIVGFESMNTARHASDIPAMYSVVGGIGQVASYDAATGKYTSYVVGFPLNDFALVPGQAYWCSCTASGVLTYAP